MKKLLSLVLSIALLVSCMFSVSASNEFVFNNNFYCGFENYGAQLTGNTTTDRFNDVSFNSTVAEIVTDIAYVGEKSIKLTLAQEGLTAFEIRSDVAFELKEEEYRVDFAYYTNANVEISVGMAKAGNVHGTAYSLCEFSAEEGENWQTATLNFTVDKGFNNGYVPAIIVYAQNGAEIYFDDITVSAVNGKSYVGVSGLEFDAAWYPTFKETNQTAE